MHSSPIAAHLLRRRTAGLAHEGCEGTVLRNKLWRELLRRLWQRLLERCLLLLLLTLEVVVQGLA